MWRSLVARFVRDEEAVGSNPATPTVNRRDRLVPAILYVHSQADCQHGRKGGNEAGAGGVATMQHAPTAVPEGGGPPPQLLSAPEGGGPPARRPRREPSARRVGSKPGQALPPPTGTAACPSGCLRTGAGGVFSTRIRLAASRRRIGPMLV